MDLLYFIKRNLFIFLGCVIISSGFGLLAGSKLMKLPVKTTMFITLGTQDSSRPEEAEAASTFFGETVVGWFRNPVFVQKINDVALGNALAISSYQYKNDYEINFNIKAFKQERQNLLIEIQSSLYAELAHSKREAKLISSATDEILSEELSRYNTATGSKFVIISIGETSKIAATKNALYLLAGMILGIIMGIALSSILELLRGVISLESEIEEITNDKPLILNEKDQSSLLFAANCCSPNVVIASANFDIKQISLSQDFKHIKKISLPKDLSYLKNSTDTLFVFVKLGKTKKQLLVLINEFYQGNIKVLITR